MQKPNRTLLDLGGLLSTYLIPPHPPLEKGGRKNLSFNAILIMKRHTNFTSSEAEAHNRMHGGFYLDF